LDVREVGAGTAILNYRRAVTTFAVDQYQGIVSRQTTQGGRTYQRGAIVDVLGLYVESRDQVTHQVVNIGGTLVLEVLRGEHVNRSRGIHCSSRCCTRPGYNNFFDVWAALRISRRCNSGD